jgi:two-component system, cell cycle response regulator
MRGRGLLVIDDSEPIRRRAVDFLRSQNIFDQYFEAEDGIAGIRVLTAESRSIDLIICDLEMPRIDGFRFLQLKNEIRSDFAEIPVIMMTSRGEVERRITGLELGAADYLVKPVDDGELLARVRVQLRIKQLQDELRANNLELERLSNTDALTGLFNRRHFMHLFQQELERAARHGGVISFVMIDIDRFKDFNDDYGHQVGDETLRHVAGVLQSGLRTGDVLARYGGEEFALLLPQTTAEGGIAAAERYRKLVESNASPAGHAVTISLGISSSDLPGIDTVDVLMKTADEALYKAKAAGRNRSERYTPDGLRPSSETKPPVSS